MRPATSRSRRTVAVVSYRLGSDGGLLHALDITGEPLCADDETDVDPAVSVVPGQTWPPSSGQRCPACDVLATARGGT